MTPEATYWRQLDILSPQQMEHARVTLIGAGGIGSPTALCLAKMGIGHMTVYDPDTIEEHNLPNQLYPMQIADVGPDYGRWVDTLEKTKVDVLNEMVKQFSNIAVRTNFERYEDQPLSGIVISAVDSMRARKDIWQQVLEQRSTIQLYIEARMGAEVGMVYTVNPNFGTDSFWYEKNMLYTDADALPLPCTATAIIYNTFMLASLVARQVKNYLTGGDLPREIVMDMVGLAILRSDPKW